MIYILINTFINLPVTTITCERASTVGNQNNNVQEWLLISRYDNDLHHIPDRQGIYLMKLSNNQ